jgi:hypothetical protein
VRSPGRSRASLDGETRNRTGDTTIFRQAANLPNDARSLGEQRGSGSIAVRGKVRRFHSFLGGSGDGRRLIAQSPRSRRVAVGERATPSERVAEVRDDQARTSETVGVCSPDWSVGGNRARPPPDCGRSQFAVFCGGFGPREAVRCPMRRPAGALLIEQNDKWLVARRYLSEESMRLILSTDQDPENSLSQDQEEATQLNTA